MFALWPMGRYGYILGQNHKILLKNRQILEKNYNHFILTSILNPCESSHDKCHRLSFLMHQTRLVCSIGHFGTKTADFGRKSVKLLQCSN
jgi:predicted ABC-class ATPase